jgi:2-oxoisovalerate dehydrogenase E2 component (dihydrolipoyl transacylase)
MLLQYRAVHVGIAVQTPQGLKVPVIRDAQALSLRAIDAEIRRLSAAARDGRARPADFTGSTITVTSLGKLGGVASTPIINQPELAIIGVNRALERPVVHQGVIAVRRMMNLSSSFDHRFIDGFDAARLIQTLRELLEQPALLFI